jgi:Tol biopolymer transport system component
LFLLSGGQGDAAYPGRAGKIATLETPTWQIRVVKADGTGARYLRPQPEKRPQNWPTWSPSGRLVAFSGFVGQNYGTSNLHIVDPTRGTWTRLLRGRTRPYDAGYPSWLDEHRLAFLALYSRGDSADTHPVGVSTIDTRTRRVRKIRMLSVENGHGISGGYPFSYCCLSASPDGRKLAFARATKDPGDDVGGVGSVYIMNANGRGLTRILTGANADSGVFIDWSPDGRRLAVGLRPGEGVGGVGVGDAEVRILRTDGTLVRKIVTLRVTPDRSSFFSAPFVSYSPDGSMIAFTSVSPAARSSADVIRVMKTDGTGVRTVLDVHIQRTRRYFQGVDWQPLPR